MARASATIIAVCLTAFLLGVNSKVVEKRGVETVSWNDYLQYFCTNGYTVYPSYLCNPYTTTTVGTSAKPTTTTTPQTTTTTTEGDDDVNDPNNVDTTTTTSTSTTESSSSSSSSSSSTTTMSGSPLERAHWCQFTNGSYLSLLQTFIYKGCSLCQCTPSRIIRCTNLQCMTTYCIDGSTPVTRPGQCCPQCAYENSSSSCLVDKIDFPTGTLLRRTTDNIQCWCSSGTAECRKSSSSMSLSSLDYWGEGTAVYVIVIVICAVLLLGTLLCCGGGLFFYYYYYNNQQTFQDAYAQYYSNAGWQPMTEDGQIIVDGVAQDKQAEAEQQQYEYQEEEYPTGQSEEYIPPPYALYNGAYAGKEQQFT